VGSAQAHVRRHRVAHGAYGADRTGRRVQEDLIEMQALEEDDGVAQWVGGWWRREDDEWRVVVGVGGVSVVVVLVGRVSCVVWVVCCNITTSPSDSSR
jgi:hypothetical protein